MTSGWVGLQTLRVDLPKGSDLREIEVPEENWFRSIFMALKKKTDYKLGRLARPLVGWPDHLQNFKFTLKKKTRDKLRGTRRTGLIWELMTTLQLRVSVLFTSSLWAWLCPLKPEESQLKQVFVQVYPGITNVWGPIWSPPQSQPKFYVFNSLV